MDYFRDRKICTRIKKENSKLGKNQYGVPQGSCLGPLLFIIFINDIFENKLNGKIIIFADDIMIYYSHKWVSRIRKKLQVDVNIINNWSKNNVVFINNEKTKVMWIKNYKQREGNFDKTIKIQQINCNQARYCKCKSIQETQDYKYLGIYWDDKLLRTRHMIYLNEKLRQLSWKFYKLKNHLPKEIIKLLYKTLIQPGILYGIECYANSINARIDCANRIQKHIIRNFLKKNINTNVIQNQLEYTSIKFLTIEQMYIKKLVIQSLKEWNLGLEVRTHKHKTRLQERANYPIDNSGNRYKKGIQKDNCI